MLLGCPAGTLILIRNFTLEGHVSCRRIKILYEAESFLVGFICLNLNRSKPWGIELKIKMRSGSHP
jgi:hypothetical protein